MKYMSLEDKDTLEGIIDASGVQTLLQETAEICHGKAEHLRSNWQDHQSARHWESVADFITNAQENFESAPAPRKTFNLTGEQIDFICILIAQESTKARDKGHELARQGEHLHATARTALGYADTLASFRDALSRGDSNPNHSFDYEAAVRAQPRIDLGGL